MAALQRYCSAQTNVEIVKFFKAVINSKDTISVSYIIKKDLFDKIMQIMDQNTNKNNLLHSCILSLFDILPHTLKNETFHLLLAKFIAKGYEKKYFFDRIYERDFRRFNCYLR